MFGFKKVLKINKNLFKKIISYVYYILRNVKKKIKIDKEFIYF